VSVRRTLLEIALLFFALSTLYFAQFSLIDALVTMCALLVVGYNLCVPVEKRNIVATIIINSIGLVCASYIGYIFLTLALTVYPVLYGILGALAALCAGTLMYETLSTVTTKPLTVSEEEEKYWRIK